jgi:hypothetical protein
MLGRYHAARAVEHDGTHALADVRGKVRGSFRRGGMLALVRPRRLLQATALLCACSGCDDRAATTCLDPPRGPAMDRFEDVTHDSGIDFRYSTQDFKGGGLAIADLDGDDRLDIVAGRRIGGLKLFRNRGSLRFQEVLGSGLDPDLPITALAAADLDNDGDRDLVLAGPGVAHIMANQGSGTFEEAARFDESGMTEHILASDLDGDGRLDLYFGNYDLRNGGGTLNRLYLNRGGLQFTAVAGVPGGGLTWTTTAFDADGDGDQDLYVANDTLLADFGRPVAGSPSTSPLKADLFLRNDGPGPDGAPHFTDIAADLGLTRPRSSMGGLLHDFDGDGRLDLYIPDYGAKKLFLRDPSGAFLERAVPLGADGTVRQNPTCGPDTEDEHCLLLSWSAALGDFDLDGHDELMVVSGETEIGKPPPVLLFARGPDPTFHEVSPSICCLDARGLIVTDLDGDGDQDVVISQKQGPLMLFENRGRPAPETWLRVSLRGQPSNRDGAGALVTAHLSDGRSITRIVAAGGVIHSSGPAEAFFGLGLSSLSSLSVQWPSGRRTELAGPLAGALVLEESTP